MLLWGMKWRMSHWVYQQAESGKIMSLEVNYSVSAVSGHEICVTVIGILKETNENV